MKPIRLVTAALITAALCIIAPITVPIGAIPLSAATLGVYLAAALLGTGGGTLCTTLYILVGAVGMPVFAGYGAGMASIMGVTGGFILGYVPCAAVIGALLSRRRDGWRVPLAFTLGTLVLYAVGCGWYAWHTAVSPLAALGVCVLPFLPADAIKIAAATALVRLLHRHTASANLSKEG